MSTILFEGIAACYTPADGSWRAADPQELAYAAGVEVKDEAVFAEEHLVTPAANIAFAQDPRTGLTYFSAWDAEEDDYHGELFESVMVKDPNEVKRFAALPISLRDHQMVVYNGVLYMFGGDISCGHEHDHEAPANRNIYAINTASKKPEWAIASGPPCGVGVSYDYFDGSIYMCNVMGSVWRFDMASWHTTLIREGGAKRVKIGKIVALKGQ